jgi:hypothetical protein
MGYFLLACSPVSARTCATVVRRCGRSGGCDAADIRDAIAARIGIQPREHVVRLRNRLVKARRTAIISSRPAFGSPSLLRQGGILCAVDGQPSPEQSRKLDYLEFGKELQVIQRYILWVFAGQRKLTSKSKQQEPATKEEITEEHVTRVVNLSARVR